MKDKCNDTRKNSKRHNRFDVKLNDAELEIVKKKAALVKMPVGRFLRVMAMKGEVKIYDLHELMALKRALNAIGNNLNQIAAVANTSGSIYKKDIEDMQSQFSYFKDAIKSYLFEISPTFIL